MAQLTTSSKKDENDWHLLWPSWTFPWLPGFLELNFINSIMILVTNCFFPSIPSIPSIVFATLASKTSYLVSWGQPWDTLILLWMKMILCRNLLARHDACWLKNQASWHAPTRTWWLQENPIGLWKNFYSPVAGSQCCNQCGSYQCSSALETMDPRWAFDGENWVLNHIFCIVSIPKLFVGWSNMAM